MIARSSKFYNTRMKIESLIDRVTLALCIIVATQCNPSNLLCHGSYDRYFGGRVRFTHTVSEARKAIEHPTHILTSGIDVLSHWCDVLEEKSQGALSSGIDSMCPLWKTLNLTLLLHYPKYICCRCEELLRYFDRLEHLIREGDVNGNIFETICTSLLNLEACSKQRFRPRIGIIPVEVEYIFEPRFSTRWHVTMKKLLSIMNS